jgi:hypothetical protein
LDDVQAVQGLKIDGGEHVRFANRLFSRLRDGDPQAELVFCPTWYMGDGSEPSHQAYLETVARELRPEVYIFWTGDGLARVTRRGAEGYRARVRHRLIFWDNYPVNDLLPILNLAPVTGRDPDLCEVADGYLSNPHHQQNEINRIPLLTCADYAYNPRAYDPARSIGQAILHLAETPEQRHVLRDLVEVSPGPLIYGKGSCSFNSLRERFRLITATPHSRCVAEAYTRYLEDLSARLKRAFPTQFEDARQTLDENTAWMRQTLTARYSLGRTP